MKLHPLDDRILVQRLQSEENGQSGQRGHPDCANQPGGGGRRAESLPPRVESDAGIE